MNVRIHPAVARRLMDLAGGDLIRAERMVHGSIIRCVGMEGLPLDDIYGTADNPDNFANNTATNTKKETP